MEIENLSKASSNVSEASSNVSEASLNIVVSEKEMINTSDTNVSDTETNTSDDINNTVENLIAITKNNASNECLLRCLNARDLDKPQHKCCYCRLPVSHICHCNKEDPKSDNPMHRVHVDKKFCQTKFDCHYCGKTAKTEEALNCHISAIHTTYRPRKPQNFNDIFIMEDGDINIDDDSDDDNEWKR